MENFKINTNIELDLDFENGIYAESFSALQKYLDSLNNCFDREQNNFVSIAYYVYQIKNIFDDYNATYFGRVYTMSNKEYTFDSIMQGFGLDRTQVCRLVNVYDKFVDTKNEFFICLKKYISGFSKSKLFELLTVDEKQLQKDISNSVLQPDMSVKQIRDYVKNYKALQKQNEKSSKVPEEKEELSQNEEIPPAYDATKHYDFAYFEKQSKAQLINIVWELQKEYERLVSKNNTKTSLKKKKCMMA